MTDETQTQASWQDRWMPAIIGVTASFLSMPFFFMLLADSVRAGQAGSMLSACYPLPLLLGRLMTHMGMQTADVILCLMLAQFALYGVAVSLLSRATNRKRATIAILLVHLAGALVAWMTTPGAAAA